jgi:hypothetical protein
LKRGKSVADVDAIANTVLEKLADLKDAYIQVNQKKWIAAQNAQLLAALSSK